MIFALLSKPLSLWKNSSEDYLVSDTDETLFYEMVFVPLSLYSSDTYMFRNGSVFTSYTQYMSYA
jgi:hypothetical protein